MLPGGALCVFVCVPVYVLAIQRAKVWLTSQIIPLECETVSGQAFKVGVLGSSIAVRRRNQVGCQLCPTHATQEPLHWQRTASRTGAGVVWVDILPLTSILAPL